MHPVFVEMFARPVGWLTLGGTAIMIGLALGIPLFIRHREKIERRQAQRKPRED